MERLNVFPHTGGSESSSPKYHHSVLSNLSCEPGRLQLEESNLTRQGLRDLVMRLLHKLLTQTYV
jgi:hypothetical protein